MVKTMILTLQILIAIIIELRIDLEVIQIGEVFFQIKLKQVQLFFKRTFQQNRIFLIIPQILNRNTNFTKTARD